MNKTVLSDAEMADFEREGYLILNAAFEPSEIAHMRAEANHILELSINSSCHNKRQSHRMDLCRETEDRYVMRKIQPINDLSLYLSQVSEDERLLGPMRQLMGDEPVLMEEKLNYKQPLTEPVEGLEAPHKSTRFPIHNDWAYYAAQDYPQTIISSAISMDDCTPDNGPLHVWPGSHNVHLEHARIDIGLEVKPGLIDPEGGVDILAPAGSVMLFHSLLVHNSRTNTTAGPRRLMIYSHYPKAANKGIDIRNGPGRLREAPYEWEYTRALLAGKATPMFKAP
ncbi:MAG: phytanoyl-CoA dioxygenase family protein [Lentisphaerae bacterium]|nr:phytanoyl-CoA dioxygenase family protein [Lentisphaerota bacterium]